MVKINYKFLIIDIILLVVIILVVRFCHSFEIKGVRAEKNIAYCLKISELPQINNYIIKDSIYSFSLSDDFTDYTLLISKSDYIGLVNIIKSKTYFKTYDSTDSPRSAYGQYSDWSKVNEVAYSYKSQTIYERFDPQIGEFIGVCLKKDSILIIEIQHL